MKYPSYSDAVVVGIVYFDETAEEVVPARLAFNWYVPKRDLDCLLIDIMFHHILAEYVEDWWQSDLPIYNPDELQVFVGYNVNHNEIFGMRFPLRIIYEVSGFDPSFNIDI
jgi:hypothetical protein